MSLADSPRARLPLFDAPRAYLEQLASTAPGDLAGRHRRAADTLADWIAARLTADQPAQIVVVCTGNSRRSILAATLGQLAAEAAGLTQVHFFSGGTEPSAFNPRTIATLQAIGLQIEPTAAAAPPGPAGQPNPIYRIRRGEALETLEFSKRYDDPANPRADFAAVMVCDEANAACPFVPGATLRLPMPFDDPKDHDGTPEEAQAYAARRDEIARVMIAVFEQVLRHLPIMRR
ncbi:MAG: arsenate reductase [Isosphaeraceae bacterium]|jgi:protein-tyrosine-phosphatase|nr:MAG: arsenate reductase [Isosphaeraceae bacterium]